MPDQLSLFEHVKAVYADSKTAIDNKTVYARVAARAGVSTQEFSERCAIGRAGARRSVYEREVRWHQQTLKSAGWLEKLPNERGQWTITKKGRESLTTIRSGITMVAFSTKLGIAIWGNCRDVFATMDEPISLAITSPPYCLRNARAYGNPSESQYIDFICESLEPIVKHLRQGGSIVLNVSNDIFMKNSPARSLYRERLIIALNERLGLFKMDEIIWASNKAPGPVQWASITRQQLNTTYEPIYWLSNKPAAVLADNRRVLEPHSARQQALITKGGESRTGVYSDGAYRINPGSFGNATSGRIPRNILSISNYCANQRDYKKSARELGLPAHGAPFPLALAEFFIKFLSEVGDLVIDMFGGSLTTAVAAEKHQRRWITCDSAWEYLRGGMERFRNQRSLALNSQFLAVS